VSTILGRRRGLLTVTVIAALVAAGGIAYAATTDGGTREYSTRIEGTWPPQPGWQCLRCRGGAVLGC
jgi:hypothetical protein